jgi:hypothetical protein
MHVSLRQFKTLLHAVKEQNIGLRVKTHTGWSKDFLHIIGFIASSRDQEQKTFAGIVLSNRSETEGVMINNISSISAFELEKPHGGFHSDTVYHLADAPSLHTLSED